MADGILILAHCLFPGFQFFFLLCYIFSLYLLLLLLLDFPRQGDLSTAPAAALFLLCLTSHHLHKFISIPSIQGLVCACFVWLLFSLQPFRLGKSLSLTSSPSLISIDQFHFYCFQFKGLPTPTPPPPSAAAAAAAAAAN